MKEIEMNIKDILDKKTGEKIGESVSYPLANSGFERHIAGVPVRGIFMDAAGDNPFEKEIDETILNPEIDDKLNNE